MKSRCPNRLETGSGQDKSPCRGSPLVEALILPGGKWTAHDLRRTGSTIMAELGVRPDVIERCLNHTEQDRMKRIYQRHSYHEEMREAWRLLGDRLTLLTGEVVTRNVVDKQ